MTVEVFDRRERWLREVLRSARLHPQTKVVLVVLYKHMRADCKVSVSRRTVASELGWRHVQRVSERIAEAHDAGFLVTITPGAYGRTATWQGVIPDCETVRSTRTVSESRNPDGYRLSTVRETRTPLLETTPVPSHRLHKQLRANLNLRRAVFARVASGQSPSGATA
jgi:hypothetical protein